MKFVSSVVILSVIVLLAACSATPTPSNGRLATLTPTPTGGNSSPTPVPTATPEPSPAGASTARPGGTPGRGLPDKPAPYPETPTPTPGLVPAVPARVFPDAPDRDLYQLAAELSLGGQPDIPRVVNPEPVTRTEGSRETFSLVDFQDMSIYQREFELVMVSSHAYWWVEHGQSIPRRQLELSAAIFEDDIYPRVTAAFGTEWTPGVDNDPHLNIIHAGLRGVGGYYSSTDEYPQLVYPLSNQREAIYINIRSLQVGSTRYLAVLAHELQHAAHWKGDPSEETWVNEGLSELASTVAGYFPDSIYAYLQAQPTSLVHWPINQVGSTANYGAAALFMHYLMEHYGSGQEMRPLVEEPADGVKGIDAYLKSQGYHATFRDVFRDWAVANLLDEPAGRYGYSSQDLQVQVRQSIDQYAQLQSKLPQYSVEYVELASFNKPIRVRFQGQPETALLAAEVGEHGCWWSNSGDSINATLTRSIDLTGLKQAILTYDIWYSIEDGWDYGYLEVSTDGGRSWKILETSHTSPENPFGNGFGPGYTGDSRGWISEKVAFPDPGRPLLLRFQYVTDDAVNGPGLCLRNISVPEAGLNNLMEGWEARGFVLTNNRVAQDYIVQLIENGPNNRVTLFSLDANNYGEIVIEKPQDVERLVVAVSALASKTLQPAPYRLTVEPVK